MRKTEQSYELTAKWYEADVSVSVKSRWKPLIRADKLADLLEAPVQVWLLRDDVKHLVYETSPN